MGRERHSDEEMDESDGTERQHLLQHNNNETSHSYQGRSYAHEVFHFIICGGGILVCYAWFGYLQETIVQGKYENGAKFTYTQALVFFLCAANTLFAYALLKVRRGVHRDNVPVPMYAVCAASYLLAMMSSTEALQFLPYPTQVLSKSCKPIPVMLFGVLFARRVYRPLKYVFVLMIVVGVAMFLYKEGKSATGESQLGAGELLLVLSLICDGTTTAIQDRMNHGYQKSSISMMFYMNIFSSFYLLVTLIASGELFEFVRFVQGQPIVVMDLLILSAASCGGQYFIFKTINEFSPLSCSIITTTRKLFTIILSVVFMNHPLSQRQVYGTVLVFTGLILDAIYSKMTKKHHHHRSKHQS